ncbi:MAG: amidohydrolase family protein [Dehalococcoidia bacterium]
MPIIDSHTHILPKDVKNNIHKYLNIDSTFNTLFSNAQNICTAEELIDSMGVLKIDTSIILGMGWNDNKFNEYVNDYLIESSKKYPEKLIPITGIIPDGHNSTVYEAERCINLGSKGFGEIHADSQNIDISDKKKFASYAEILQLNNLPLILHSSEPVGHKYPGKGSSTPNKIEQFVYNFPELKIILAHWGGGMFLYELMPEISSSFKNVYYDSATSPFLYNQKIFQIAIETVTSNKILFGSDFPVISQSRPLNELHNVIIKDKDIENILYQNAKSLFLTT